MWAGAVSLVPLSRKKSGESSCLGTNNLSSHDGFTSRPADLKSLLMMVHKVIEFEESHSGKVVTLPSTSVQHMTLAERMAAVSD